MDAWTVHTSFGGHLISWDEEAVRLMTMTRGSGQSLRWRCRPSGTADGRAGSARARLLRSSWLGLVPRPSAQSIRNWVKPRLGKISKMGQRDLRRLLITGAMSVVRNAARRLRRDDGPLGCASMREILRKSRGCSLQLRSGQQNGAHHRPGLLTFEEGELPGHVSRHRLTMGEAAGKSPSAGTTRGKVGGQP